MELVGQRTQALGEQRELLGSDGELAGLGAEDLALDADDVADVELLEGRVLLVSELVPADVDLDVALVVAKMREAGLAHDPLGHDAAGEGGLLPGIGLSGKLRELLLEVGGIGVLIELCDGIWVLPLGLKLLELVLPDEELFCEV